MSEPCETCNGKKYFEYYDSVAICADCSDDTALLDIIKKLEKELSYTKEELRKEREVVDYYADSLSWAGCKIKNDHAEKVEDDQSSFMFIGGKRARQRQKERK